MTRHHLSLDPRLVLITRMGRRRQTVRPSSCFYNSGNLGEGLSLLLNALFCCAFEDGFIWAVLHTRTLRLELTLSSAYVATHEVHGCCSSASSCSWRNVSLSPVWAQRHSDTWAPKSFFCGLGCHVTPHFLPSYMDVDSLHPKHIMRTCYSDCFYTVSSSYSLLGIYFLHSSILAGSSERVPQRSWTGPYQHTPEWSHISMPGMAFFFCTPSLAFLNVTMSVR